MDTTSRQGEDPGGPVARKGRWWVRGMILVAVAGAGAALYMLFGESLSLKTLAEHESSLKRYQADSPVLVFAAAFFVYVVVTGLSLPGATVLTLVYGWFFGFVPAVILVSFASTTGATLAFLLSRFLFRDWVRQKFSSRMDAFEKAFQRDGPWYLFTLRLVPAFPFFAINLLMGLTPIRTWTYWWVSQLGMLAGTMVYVFAGASVPHLQKLADSGVQAAFTGQQMLQFTIAFALLGLLPVVVRKIVALRSPASEPGGQALAPVGKDHE